MLCFVRDFIQVFDVLRSLNEARTRLGNENSHKVLEYNLLDDTRVVKETLRQSGIAINVA